MAQRATAKKGHSQSGSGGSRRSRRRPALRRHWPRLLAFCYFTRYVTVDIVVRAFPGVIGSKTAAKEQLKQLRDLGLLKAAPRAAITEPLVYSVTAKTVRLLNRGREPDRQLAMVRDETVKAWLLAHELGLSELQTDIRLAAQSHPNLEILFFERRYHQEGKRLLFPTNTGEVGDLRPDLGFLACFDPRGRRNLLHHFAEYDRGTEPPDIWLAKMRAYDAWFHTVGRDYLVELYRRHGTVDPRPVYRRLIVTRARPGKDVSDEDRLVKLMTKTMELDAQSRFNIFLTTDELLRANGDGQPLSEPIWYPARFTRPWEGEYDALCHDLARRRLSRHNRSKQLYAWATSKVQIMSRFTLFPPT